MEGFTLNKLYYCYGLPKKKNCELVWRLLMKIRPYGHIHFDVAIFDLKKKNPKVIFPSIKIKRFLSNQISIFSYAKNKLTVSFE